MKPFAAMACDAGYPLKGGYKVIEIAKISGVPRTRLYRAVEAREIETFLPPGAERGMLIAPEAFDCWREKGMMEVCP